MTRRALFLVNGLGLGNSTRCAAVIGRLVDLGFKVDVVTSANGLWYFRQCLPEISVHEIFDLQYGAADGKLSVSKTLGSVPNLLRIIRQNRNAIRTIILDIRPDVVVTDSTYVFRLSELRDIPTVGLNNADAVVREYSLTKGAPFNTLPQFLCMELMDHLYHKIFVDYVVSPSIKPSSHRRSGHTESVGPIVRPQYLAHSERRTSRDGRVMVMLSGSKFGTIVSFSRPSFEFEIDVIGRAAPVGAINTKGLNYHGKIVDTHHLAADADLMIVNGGFSAVSEAVMLRKPVVVIPVPKHAEQWVNAKSVVDLGIGMTATEENLEIAMLAAWERLDEFNQAYAELRPLKDGATQAAAFIASIS